MAGEDFRQWILQNKLKAIFGFWATGLSVSLAYQWSRPIPTQLKLIHSRVYAQALTLAGLGIAGAVQWMEDSSSQPTQAPKATGLDL
ncbi:hypoxia induced conserved region containing [Chlorella sorokiniana]|uniref:Hypoxia induced conserved region containing n=1 Tax=Chlorella sorokiniana TaxID=3076 RepID=A0A2P6U3A1_CHLSO|nr:hypoxia induced conserved region containing [Chlorella sorokiniana]|eukprot:PRW60792.1 hypoxia induced conserved region containing [Chlorella sorokiniana]